MKNIYHKITAGASVLPLLLPFATNAQQQGGGLSGAQGQLTGIGTALSGINTQGAGALPALIGRLINAFLGVLGIILVVYLVWAGFLWMTASGEEEKVKKAKAMIQQSVIGMVIVIAAYAIASFVINVLVGATG